MQSIFIHITEGWSKSVAVTPLLRLALYLAAVGALLMPVCAQATEIRFYGDLLLSRGLEKFVRDRGPEPVRDALAPFLSRDAVHVVNLEGSVGSACEPGKTPCFPIRRTMLDLLDGFDVVSLQNNHSLDTGPDGLRQTAEELRRKGIVPLAGKKSSTIIDTEAGKVAVVSATDVVNARADRNYMVSADAPELLREIGRLKKRSTIVAVYVHWGRELVATPTVRMKELARKYVKAGADVVVGTHPHVAGGAACIEGKPVVWSLGNFLFDQKYDSTKHGAVLSCGVAGGRLSCRLIPHDTPHGSYLPACSTAKPYESDNSLLSSCAPPVTASWSGRFSHDGREKRLFLVPDGTQGMFRLVLYDRQCGRREARTPAMPIRKVQTVDLNGDGIQEVMLIQDIYSSFDREVAKRVYIYSFDSGFHALWRGTVLSRPLLDAAFIKQRDDKKPLLVALHSDETFLKRNRGTKGRIIMWYRWNGFGFSGVAEQRAPASSQHLRVRNGKLVLRREEKGDTEDVRIMASD